MEILDPDLWNEDGTPKKPSKEYMESLAVAQSGDDGAFINFARIKREARSQRPAEIGDIVHFWHHEHSACRAAIVMETGSFGHDATLRVHIPNKPFEDWHVDHDETKRADQGWHWPCGEGQ